MHQLTQQHRERELTNSVELNEVRPVVQVVQDIDAREWNDFLARQTTGTLFHRPEWEQVFAVYRLPFFRLAALSQVSGVRCQLSGARPPDHQTTGPPDHQTTRPPDDCSPHIVGVLPLVWQKSLLFGKQLVSLPTFDAAGVLADDVGARGALVGRALELAAECRADSLLIRLAAPLDSSCQPWPTADARQESLGHQATRPPDHHAVRTDKMLLRLKLPSDPDALWKGFDPKVRNQVRKGQKSGLEVKTGKGELLDDFFRVYSHNMRDLGSPSHSQRFFRAIIETFSKEVAIYVVWHDKEAIGAGFTMANGDRLDIPWASSLRSYNKLCVNHMMYWQILEDACRQGFQWFHFGRSTPGSGQYKFKKQWGAEDVQLYWCSWSTSGLGGAGTEDRGQGSGEFGKVEGPRTVQDTYGWATKIWRRLPLCLTRWLGPKFIAKIP